MKVFNLRCAAGHRFEGWFASDQALAAQQASGQLRCPLCDHTDIHKLPSAPHVHTRATSPKRAHAPSPTPPGQAAPSTPSVPGPAAARVLAQEIARGLQAQWAERIREVLASTDHVGTRFAEEARRIHWGEAPERPICGEATVAEAQALHDEGIEVQMLPWAVPSKDALQ